LKMSENNEAAIHTKNLKIENKLMQADIDKLERILCEAKLEIVNLKLSALKKEVKETK